MERDADSGRIVKPPPATVIRSREKATELHRARRQKAARLLRQRLAEETAAVIPMAGSGSAAAVAEAGAMLWAEVVLNSEAYPRDRLDAWQKLAAAAEVLQPAGSSDSGSDAGSDAGLLAGLGREAVLEFIEARRQQRQQAAAAAAQQQQQQQQLPATSQQQRQRQRRTAGG